MNEKLKHTIANAVAKRGDFDGNAVGYVLLNYPPCLHLAAIVNGKVQRFLPLTRTNLRTAFGPEQGDSLWQSLLIKRLSMRSVS